ncbi:MAG: rhamnogalacturonan acetylesterase [Gammaproteobacteria bacterium]
MTPRRLLLPALLSVLAACAPVVTVPPQPGAMLPERIDAPKLEPYKIILVGDSTTAVGSGWGGAFCAHHVEWKIACLNLARGARSTRSYRAEGSWDVALSEMKVPGYKATYVLIQMGHNDQSPKPERWTEQTTEFPDNLRRFVRETRDAGAVPVLITPLSRREFRQGRIHNTLAPWSEQVRIVARELDVPLIDLNAQSVRLAERLGPVGAMALAQLPPSAEERAAAATGTTLPPREPEPKPEDEDATEHPPGPRGHYSRKFDYTHLGDHGAELISALIAHDLAVQVPELSRHIVP